MLDNNALGGSTPAGRHALADTDISADPIMAYTLSLLLLRPAPVKVVLRNAYATRHCDGVRLCSTGLAAELVKANAVDASSVTSFGSTGTYASPSP
ncbi:hypothetical protein DQ04_02161010 [Trypanosoma grayi]|uniref:hypothetical protein n=1 Tax=Trypanosoma grayi TaxID=71804 RepID=UPI0004F433E2|nr:hypothetical protein DQ04_02161010 [Trypanosoma grayi]KEG11907.1 hypothetical protein DQ04_02161010 [Trypanosoma grayi]